MPTSLRRRDWIGMLFAIAVILVVGLLAWRTSREQVPTTQALPELHIGLTGSPDILDLPYFIAKERGYFDKEGLNVKYTFITGDATSIQALQSGSVDFASAGLLTIMRAIERGAEIKAFVAVAKSHDYRLIAKSDIKAPSELRGRRIGIYAPGDITETVTQAYLQREGIQKSELNWISLGGSTERFNGLIAGRVDVVPLHIDDATRALEVKGFVLLADLAREMPLPMSAVAARTRDFNDRRETLDRVTRSLMRASRHAAANRDDFVQMGLKYIEGLSKEQIEVLHGELTGSQVIVGDGGISLPGVENAMRALESLGVRVQGPATRYVDLSVIESARRALK